MTDIYRLTTVLTAGYRRDDLGHNGTCHLKALRRFDKFSIHHRTVVEHITDIHQTTVEDRLQKIIGIVEMKDSLFVSLGYLFRKKHPFGKVL